MDLGVFHSVAGRLVNPHDPDTTLGLTLILKDFFRIFRLSSQLAHDRSLFASTHLP